MQVFKNNFCRIRQVRIVWPEAQHKCNAENPYENDNNWDHTFSDSPELD